MSAPPGESPVTTTSSIPSSSPSSWALETDSRLGKSRACEKLCVHVPSALRNCCVSLLRTTLFMIPNSLYDFGKPETARKVWPWLICVTLRLRLTDRIKKGHRGPCGRKRLSNQLKNALHGWFAGLRADGQGGLGEKRLETSAHYSSRCGGSITVTQPSLGSYFPFYPQGCKKVPFVGPFDFGRRAACICEN